MAYDHGEVHLQAKIKLRMDKQDGGTELVETTVGRALLKDICPPQIPFEAINKVMGKKQLAELIDLVYREAGQKATVLLADALRTTGYTYATQRRHLDLHRRHGHPAVEGEPARRGARRKSREIEEQYTEGLITDGERYNKVVDIWAQVAEAIAKDMMKEISTDEFKDPETGRARRRRRFNSIFIMADSGARGSQQQMRQLAGMRGLMAKPSGEIIETPITTNFREGLSVLQYFISTHGARKGLADTALKTANSGYLTRRLVDVSQDTIISEFDCGTLQGIEMMPLDRRRRDHRAPRRPHPRPRRARGHRRPVHRRGARARRTRRSPRTTSRSSTDAGIDRVKIRSVLTCETRRGICSLCYGRDLARGHMVNIGEAVGVIAAQSIGEPGTQLTMRTFHIGGVGQIRTEQIVARGAQRGHRPAQQRPARSSSKDHSVVMNRQGELVARRRHRPRARALRPAVRRAR